MRYIWTITSVLSMALGLAASPVPWPPAPTDTPWCKLLKYGPAIIADSPLTPINGFQLSVDTATPKLVGKGGFTGSYDFIGGGIGAWRGCHDYWLNINTSPHSYKPLTWDFDSKLTTTWTASSGSLVQAGSTPDYAATNLFLACNQSGAWVVYLQTGTDVPLGVTCYLTHLKVG